MVIEDFGAYMSGHLADPATIAGAALSGLLGWQFGYPAVSWLAATIFRGNARR